MKRFLVCAMGDGEQYISSYIVAEISKTGEHDILKMIHDISEDGVHIPWEGSTLRYVYKVIYGDNRKDILDENSMKLLYLANVRRYNEK